MDEDEVSSGELARSLSRIESRLDRALDDHEQRLRRLEHLTWVAVGLAVAGGSSGIGALLSATGH